jgi:hypothetical protein
MRIPETPEPAESIRIERRTEGQIHQKNVQQRCFLDPSQLDFMFSRLGFIDTAKIMAEIMIERGYTVPEVEFSSEIPTRRKLEKDDAVNV